MIQFKIKTSELRNLLKDETGFNINVNTGCRTYDNYITFNYYPSGTDSIKYNRVFITILNDWEVRNRTWKKGVSHITTYEYQNTNNAGGFGVSTYDITNEYERPLNDTEKKIISIIKSQVKI